MGLLCDFCGKQRSMIYCRPDAACLCLSCDRVSTRRTLFSCRTCALSFAGDAIRSQLLLGASRKTYPFAAVVTGVGMRISFWQLLRTSNGRDNDLGANGELSTSVGSSLKFVENPLPFTSDQQARLIDPTTPKLCCTETNGHETCKDDHLYEDLNVDDIDLSFENYEELLQPPQTVSALMAEASSSGQVESTHAACSTAASADSLMSNPGVDSDPIPCFPSMQACSPLSFIFWLDQ
uniref:B box-type domain-containing protein n=1 Tax=Ananas comosus var. bracteatus TaxID=296719 RepID=A0A6V7PLB0_ANACO|nr:unnamed protein product [Ananas comosus var. bracteatus]